MKRLANSEILELAFGSKIRVIWHNSKYHKKNAEYYGVVFGNKIGYENGLTNKLIDIAKCVFNDLCMVYLIEE